MGGVLVKVVNKVVNLSVSDQSPIVIGVNQP